MKEKHYWHIVTGENVRITFLVPVDDTMPASYKMTGWNNGERYELKEGEIPKELISSTIAINIPRVATEAIRLKKYQYAIKYDEQHPKIVLSERDRDGNKTIKESGYCKPEEAKEKINRFKKVIEKNFSGLLNKLAHV
jgi:hypothetical protein